MTTTEGWVCRNYCGDYIVCPLATEPIYEAGWKQRDRKGERRDIRVDARDLHGRIHLKPGEGPRKIEITVKFVD